MRPTRTSSSRATQNFGSPSSNDETSFDLDYTNEAPSTSRAAAAAAASRSGREDSRPTRENVARSSTENAYAKKSTSKGPHNAEYHVKPRSRKQQNPQRAVKFLREVRRLQNHTGFLIPRQPFGRLVREMILSQSPQITTISKLAFEALQESTEMYITQVFNDAYLLTQHRNRVTLSVQDIELLRVLSHGLAYDWQVPIVPKNIIVDHTDRNQFPHFVNPCDLCGIYLPYKPTIEACVDLEPGREGGTWLAIGGHNGVFKIGALLNLTGEPKPRNATGRGMIVADYVKSSDDCSIEDYNERLMSQCVKYSAFNFVSIEIGSSTKPATIAVCSNMPPTLEHYKERKCYGFGNSLPSVPLKKVEHGQQKFKDIVTDFHNKLENQADGDVKPNNNIQKDLISDLLTLLQCKEKFWPDKELARRAPNWGMELSSLNVDIPNENYGSRTHTVILVDDKNVMHFIEETMTGLNPAEPRLKTHIEIPYFQE